MSVLNDKYLMEQKQYYLMSGHWLQLEAETVLATPVVVKTLDMATCTLEDAKGVEEIPFDFIVTVGDTDIDTDKDARHVSGIGGWFTVDFKSRTDDIGKAHAPPDIKFPVHLSTGPEVGGEFCISSYIFRSPMSESNFGVQSPISHSHLSSFSSYLCVSVTHWGQQMFYLPSTIPLTDSSDIQINGKMEMIRSKEYSRLYNVRFHLNQSTGGDPIELTYQIV